MSMTKKSTLSYVHCIFRTLQDHLKSELAKLPDSTPLCIRDGLVAAHRKLSDYYLKFDDSPYYIWASSMFHASLVLGFLLILNPKYLILVLVTRHFVPIILTSQTFKTMLMSRWRNYASTTIGSMPQHPQTNLIHCKNIQA